MARLRHSRWLPKRHLDFVRYQNRIAALAKGGSHLALKGAIDGLGLRGRLYAERDG